MPLRTCMPYFVKLLFLCCFGGILTSVQRSHNQWDYFVFTQLWPEASCIEINETDRKCVIPDGVDGWTVHGLWPSANKEKGPYYCNDSWPFRVNQIKDIQPLLEKRWPNLILGESVSSFWKHEWVKHGTCAATLPALQSQHKYFAATLRLQEQFNLTRSLSRAGIHPFSNTSVMLDTVRRAIQNSTQHYARILCMESKKKTEQVLAQVEICLNKDFLPIDCDKSKYTSGCLENPRFVRLERSENYPAWDPYPYYPQFMDCKDNLPIKYLPIVF